MELISKVNLEPQVPVTKELRLADRLYLTTAIGECRREAIDRSFNLSELSQIFGLLDAIIFRN